jgi:hypothetical protein
MVDLVCGSSNASPVWGVVDLFRWTVVPARLGGGKAFIQKFKDAWVRHNKVAITAAAAQYNLMPELLAGVCWIEAGGDPTFVDRVAFEVRAFDWSGPSITDRLAVTSSPSKTSFGAVSMQLRTAAQTMGLNPSTMSMTDFRALASCLERDVFNIDTVARHLRQLADHDKLPTPLSMDQVRIVGARYNRGVGLSLEQIKKNTSYGDFIVKFWPRFHSLIQ